ncbi:alpha/beta hydrolase [Gemmatimonadota bacterium]
MILPTLLITFITILQEPSAVMTHLDIPYAGPDSDPVHQVLDVFAPPDASDLPVVFFIHGGAFHMSDKSDAEYYPETGFRFAVEGWVTVLPNYRLSPAVQYPEHARDIAAALRWTIEHIDRYGGDPGNVFVSGHSAGGFLAAAVVLDESFLRDIGGNTDGVRGVIPICGQFEVVDEGRQETFGTAPDRWPGFSPLNHIRADAPPFLILEAVRDDWWAPGQAEVFHDRLKGAGGVSAFHDLDHDHFTIIRELGLPGDPTMEIIGDFIRRFRR